MLDRFADFLIVAIPMFLFGYPFIMSWYWMAGGALYYFTREISADAEAGRHSGETWQPISILVPCYNEGDNAEETLGTTAGRAGIDCKSKVMPSVTVYFAMSA